MDMQKLQQENERLKAENIGLECKIQGYRNLTENLKGRLEFGSSGHAGLAGRYKKLSAKYANLSTQYNDLVRQYKALAAQKQGPCHCQQPSQDQDQQDKNSNQHQHHCQGLGGGPTINGGVHIHNYASNLTNPYNVGTPDAPSSPPSGSPDTATGDLSDKPALPSLQDRCQREIRKEDCVRSGCPFVHEDQAKLYEDYINKLPFYTGKGKAKDKGKGKIRSKGENGASND